MFTVLLYPTCAPDPPHYEVFGVEHELEQAFTPQEHRKTPTTLVNGKFWIQPVLLSLCQISRSLGRTCPCQPPACQKQPCRQSWVGWGRGRGNAG